MYVPDAFREDRPEVLHALMRAHPLALLITQRPDGVTVNPVPFVIYPEEGEQGVLRAHVARANGQWRELAEDSEAVVVFQGADSYVTPSWYATKAETGKVVPTWNYALVEARGPARAIADESWLRRQVDDLTAVQEGGRPAPWAVSDAPAPFVAAQMRGIVGVEVRVALLTGKWKMSQNQPEANRAGVVRGLAADGQGAVAQLVEGVR
jgi:transcriptional regulator